MALPLLPLSRLGRWPRRIAALCCLVLAAGSAVTARRGPAAGADAGSHSGNPILSRLSPGKVAAPVTVGGTAATGYLRTGDRIDLYATADDSSACTGLAGASPIGTALPVLAVGGSAHAIAGDDHLGLVVAVDHAVAARLATLQTCGMFAVLDKYP
jgi:hypothetical protein